MNRKDARSAVQDAIKRCKHLSVGLCYLCAEKMLVAYDEGPSLRRVAQGMHDHYSEPHRESHVHDAKIFGLGELCDALATGPQGEEWWALNDAATLVGEIAQRGITNTSTLVPHELVEAAILITAAVERARQR